MRVERNNPKSQEKAINIIDGFLDRLVRHQFSGGVKISDPYKNWQRNKMSFSFKVKKSFFLSVTLSGTITVTGEKIVLDCSIPGFVTTFVDENKIRQVINKNFDELFRI
jgi:hypothetical protein